MRKLPLFFSLLLALPFRLFSQASSYHPFPDSNAHWMESTWWVTSPVPCAVFNDYTLFISGDTILNGKTYHKIYQTGFIYSSNCPPPGNNYFNEYRGALRQDIALKKVYFFSPSSTSEALLYDFDLSLGDTLPYSFNNGQMNYVSNIDSVTVGISYHKRFLLKPVSGSIPPVYDTNIAIIEGIGSTFGLYNPMTFFIEAGGKLNCFKKDIDTYPDTMTCNFALGEYAMQEKKSEIIISPNPSSGRFTITSSEKFEFLIYDVFGREVFRPLPALEVNESIVDLSDQSKGIYFIKGTSERVAFSEKIILY